jgi:hypothetical protein
LLWKSNSYDKLWKERERESVCVCVCVCVALVIQHTMRMRHSVVRGLPRCKIFFHITSQTARFKKKSCWTPNVRFVWNISRSEKKWDRNDKKCVVVFRCSTRYSCLILIKLEFPRQIFEKKLKYQISWKSVLWIRVIPCGRTDMTKLIVAFRNFAGAPKKVVRYPHSVCAFCVLFTTNNVFFSVQHLHS